MPTFALVVTAAPGPALLEPHHVAQIWSGVPAAQRIGEAWLARSEAWQAVVTAADEPGADALRGSAEAALAGLPVDVNVVPAAGRRKQLLVADMESTIIEQECLDELAEFVGLREKISTITQRAMRGETEFEAALRERVALLKGLDAGVLEAVYSSITLTAGAETLIKTMRHQGSTCALVSGGFTYFTERIADRLGFDTQQANRLEIRHSKLTGRVLEPVLGREAKLRALDCLTSDLSLDVGQTLAVGDGANDLAMLGAAGLGVAFHAKDNVARVAARLPNCAVIVHGDLTALLYLQGYRSDEFVA
jgi:phosphoserine phosphatase